MKITAKLSPQSDNWPKFLSKKQTQPVIAFESIHKFIVKWLVFYYKAVFVVELQLSAIDDRRKWKIMVSKYNIKVDSYDELPKVINYKLTQYKYIK